MKTLTRIETDYDLIFVCHPTYSLSFMIDGAEHWYNIFNDEHRKDNCKAPAVLMSDGYNVWYKNGAYIKDGRVL